MYQKSHPDVPKRFQTCSKSFLGHKIGQNRRKYVILGQFSIFVSKKSSKFTIFMYQKSHPDVPKRFQTYSKSFLGHKIGQNRRKYVISGQFSIFVSKKSSKFTIFMYQKSHPDVPKRFQTYSKSFLGHKIGQNRPKYVILGQFSFLYQKSHPKVFQKN